MLRVFWFIYSPLAIWGLITYPEVFISCGAISILLFLILTPKGRKIWVK